MKGIVFGIVILFIFSCKKSDPLSGEFYDLKSKYDIILFNEDTLILFKSFNPFITK